MTKSSSWPDWRRALRDGPGGTEDIFRAFLKVVDHERNADCPPREFWYTRGYVEEELRRAKKKTSYPHSSWREILKHLVDRGLLAHRSSSAERSKAGGKPVLMELTADVLVDEGVAGALQRIIRIWGVDRVIDYCSELRDYWEREGLSPDCDPDEIEGDYEDRVWTRPRRWAPDASSGTRE